MKKYKPESAGKQNRQRPPAILPLSSRLIMVYGHRRATAFFPIPPATKIDKTRRL